MDASNSFDDVMGRLRAGQDAAATQLFRRFANRLIGLARTRLERTLRPKVDPEDVLQSVFRSFFVRHGEGQFEVGNWDSLWTILTVITVRKCANQGQHYRRDRRNVRREVAPDPAPDQSIASWEAISREPSPDHAAALTETLEQVMARLDERDREILSLSLQGLTLQEISAKVGYAQRTVRRTLDHIRHDLEKLQEQAFEDA